MDDYRLDEELERVKSINNDYYAQLAAKLVINNYERDDAVNSIKRVNESRDESRGNNSVYIPGDDENEETFLEESCNYPSGTEGKFDPKQVYKIAQELRHKFD
ncbi:TPA: hypothetical protein PXM39_003795 [Yersinia enterocolitica]|nr:hypothetical protein [Yersinia enterocolitica]